MAAAAVAMVFLSALCLAAGVGVAQGARGRELAERIERVRGGAAVAVAAGGTGGGSVVRALIDAAVRRLRPYAAYALPSPDDVRRRMLWAGLDVDLERFGALRLMGTAFGAAVGGLLLGGAIGSFAAVLFTAALGAVAGWAAPDLWLTLAVRRRHAQVDRELPAFVDFLATSAQAGLPLETALERVRQEFPGAVADAFAAAHRARDAGQTLEEALEWAAERLGHPDVAAVAATIARAQEYGTPLSAVLSDLGRTLRQERRDRARERAGRTGILLVLPLVAFILPVTMILLGYPAGVSLLKALFGV